MSTPTKARGKRALPSVPFNRAAGTDRIVTTTPKSSHAISKKTDLNSARVDVMKNRNYTSQQKQKNGPIMSSKAPSSESLSRRKDLSSSESGSNTSSPLNSPSVTRKATVGPVVAEIIDKFSSTTVERNDAKEETSETISTEKKIARVLPMTPEFIDEHLITNTESDPSSTKRYEPSSLIINKLQSTLGLISNNDGVKGSEIKLDRAVLQSNVVVTPSISTTPEQVFSADGEEGSSVRVGVRVRPFLPR